MGLTALLVSVLASAFTSYSGLFQSRDNELLLSLPIPPAVIFGVRVSTVYLACLIYLLMAWVPAVVCYGLLAAHPLAGVLLGLENTIRFTQAQGREVHYRTIEARDWLRSQGVKLPGEP